MNVLNTLLTVRWTRDLPKLHGGLDAGPLLIFDESGSVLVISALDNFMAASYEHDVNTSTISWGIMGKVNAIPKGFQYSTIMYYSASGINKVMCLLTVLYLFTKKTAPGLVFVLKYNVICASSSMPKTGNRQYVA